MQGVFRKKLNLATLIRSRQGVLDLSNRKLADEIGVSGQMVSNYRKGSVPEPDKRDALAKALGITRDDIERAIRNGNETSLSDQSERDIGDAPMGYDPGPTTPHSTLNSDEEIMRFSAGDGAAGSPIVRSRAELEVSTGMRASGLEPIFVEGDSMEPEIRANSWAWIRPAERIEGPGIYAVEIERHRLVKRFDIRMGGVLRVSGADESRYPPEEWAPCEDADKPNTYRSLSNGSVAQLFVKGRVVAYTRVT